jgi:tetratricopeptide (TPR) repeat protein
MSSVEDLKRQLEAAYAAIQELDDDLAAGRLSATDHAELKAKSERQAAALVQRLREAERRPRQAGKAPAPAAPAFGAWLKGPVGLTLGAVVLVSVGVGVGMLLARSATDEPPAASAVAPTPGSVMPGGPSASAKLEALRQEAARDNASIPTLLAFAHVALDEGQMAVAIDTYRRVLAREPKNVEAITHMGGILYQADHVDQALARIDEALAIDPDYAHAHWDRAHILFQAKQDYAGAARTLEKFLTLIPDGEDAARARALLTEARAQLARTGKPAPPAPGPAKSSLPSGAPAGGRRG